LEKVLGDIILVFFLLSTIIPNVSNKNQIQIIKHISKT